jgi:hypothetical protein
MRQAQGFRRARPADIWVCWDLDNTLVRSGALVHAGTPLRDAVVEAEPVPNMLDFFEAMRARLPDAEHFVVTARRSSMRNTTHGWLERHGVTLPDGAVCLVPDAEAKRRIWQRLAEDAQLVIVDDLSYEHENDQPSIYEELVDCAKRTADVYIGFEEIAEIAASSEAVGAVASRVVDSLTR